MAVKLVDKALGVNMKSFEISHFYLGKVTDNCQFGNFLEEIYIEKEDDQPLSEFYGSQGEVFCDHDFMEVGFREHQKSLALFFAPYSYAEYWSESVCAKAKTLGLEDANALIFISKEQIDKPRSVAEKGFELVYIGEYKYPI